jgi:hypothetical protein
MKFNDTPLFITDDAGNRIKVILHIEDFYQLLAAVDARKAAEQVADLSVNISEPAFSDAQVAKQEVVAATQPVARVALPEVQPHLPTGLLEAVGVTTEADAPESNTANARRKTHEEVFSQAFELVKARKGQN